MDLIATPLNTVTEPDLPDMEQMALVDSVHTKIEVKVWGGPTRTALAALVMGTCPICP